MPPKKRGRHASTRSPDPGLSPAATKPSASPNAPSPPSRRHDPWTTEQEIELLKRIITHKPTGRNKRMNMLSIYTSLESQGIVYKDPNRRSAATHHDHLRIPNLWSKLATMYDLDALDDREHAAEDELEEDALAEQAEAAPASTPAPKRGRSKHDGAEPEPEPILWRDFSLDSLQDSDDAAEFGERMFRRRLRNDSEPPSSPSAIAVADAEPRAAKARTPRAVRGRPNRRGSRATESTGEEYEIDELARDHDQEGPDEGEDEDDEAADDDEGESTPATRSTRGSTRGTSGPGTRRGKRKR